MASKYFVFCKRLIVHSDHPFVTTTMGQLNYHIKGTSKGEWSGGEGGGLIIGCWCFDRECVEVKTVTRYPPLPPPSPHLLIGQAQPYCVGRRLLYPKIKILVNTLLK
jgi:hypothetical protein